MGSRPVGAKKLKKEYDNFHEHERSRIGDKGNQILYDMCKKYPNHKYEDKIRAKIWLIGRAYSVAIERRPLKGMKKISNDDLYTKVSRKMKDPEIDSRIKRIPKKVKELNVINIGAICDAHQYLMKKFKIKKLITISKRSLASKYLHFHRPLVPIYDSRAKNIVHNIPKNYKDLEEFGDIKNADKEYLDFVKDIFCFQRFLKNKGCKKRTVRDIDKYLIEKAG